MSAATRAESGLPGDPAQVLNAIVSELGRIAPADPIPAPVLEQLYDAAYAELQAQRPQQALLLLVFLTSQAPFEPRFAEALGVAYARLGEFEKSVAMLGLACHLQPASPIPLFHMAESLAALGQRAAAVALLEAVEVVCGEQARHAEIRRRAQARLLILNE